MTLLPTMLADNRRRAGLSVVGTLAPVFAAASCGDAHQELRSELETFPAPAYLILLQQSVEGPPRCFAGDCPRVSRYYASESALEGTCADMRRAVDTWDVDDAAWRSDPCSLSTTRGGDEVGVAVFDATDLPPSVVEGISPAELDGYQSAVVMELRRG